MIAVGFAAVVLAAAALIPPGGDDPAAGSAKAASDGTGRGPSRSSALHYPTRAQIKAAKRFAASRGGSVAFAVIDGRGRLRVARCAGRVAAGRAARCCGPGARPAPPRPRPTRR